MPATFTATPSADRKPRLSPELARVLGDIPTAHDEPPEVTAFRRGEFPGDPAQARVLLEWCSCAGDSDLFSAVANSMDRLETVALRSSWRWAPFITALRDAPPATELTMSRVGSSPNSEEHVLVDYVQGNPQLCSLALHECAIRTQTYSALMKVLAEHPGIERLEIRTNDGPDSNLAWLPDLAKALQAHARLKDLSLQFVGTRSDRQGHNRHCEALCEAIADNADLPLERLRLPSFGGTATWDPKGARVERLLVNHPALKSLELTYAPGLTAGSWTALGQMNRLEKLILDSFGIEAYPGRCDSFTSPVDGFGAVLRECRSLRYFRFSGGELDATNVEGLRAAIANCRLDELDLPGQRFAPETENAILAGLAGNVTVQRARIGDINDPGQSFRKPTQTAEVVAIAQRNKTIQAIHGRAFAQGAFESTMAEMGLPKDIGKTLGRQMIDGTSEGYRAAAHLGASNNGTRTLAYVGTWVASSKDNSAIQQELDRRVFNDVRLTSDEWQRMNPFFAPRV